jgi:peptidoglycan/xylan/chitin deacetylase (PgdA/CDA1 family)
MFHDVPASLQNSFYELVKILNQKYQILSCDEFHLFLDGKLKSNSKKIFITFDDGFYSNYIVSKQILNPLNINALFFILPKFINSHKGDMESFVINSMFNGSNPNNMHQNDMRPMSWEDIAELIKDGHSIGGHTNSHSRLSTMNDKSILHEELISSANYIEKKLNIEVKDFAYPFGSISSINSNAMKMAKKRYYYIYSGVRGTNYVHTNKSALRREVINLKDNLEFNLSIINGGLSIFYREERKTLDDLALK